MVVEILAMADETAKIITCADAGRIGGEARARKLTSEDRTRIAKLAAHARWARKLAAPDPTDPTDPQGPIRELQKSGILSSSRRPLVRVSVAPQIVRSHAAAA